MPSFDTPEPIAVTAHVGAGSIRLTAGERLDTVVEVRPADPKRDKDVRAAEQTEVSYASGVLTVSTKERRFIGPTGAVDVSVELPTGSRVDATGSWTQVLGEGRLGEVRVKTSGGDVRLDATGPLQLTASHGSVLKNSHGATTVGTAVGDLRVKHANGDINVTRAEGSLAATTAYGTLRVGEVARGDVQLETSYGAIEVGIREGTAAWLDAHSNAGQVRNTLTASDAPGETEDTVKVRARTKYGNIDVRRAKI
jgi:DUF4097 and DUF4098 domain-containing protein YvlB